MSKEFEKKAKELFEDIQFYCTEDTGEFIFGSKNMKKSFIKMLEEYIEDFKKEINNEN